ncbi:MAG: cytochrome bc1 complex diheme cytochrome c subunit [Acidimicrobiales bacterium]
MGLRLLRKILMPFAALVLAATVATFLMGRVHETTTASASASPLMSLTGLQAQSAKGAISTGYTLFQEHCAFCHGTQANGTTGIAPNLQGLGAGTVQLWLSTGWMPLKTPSAQPENTEPSFSPRAIRDIASWVASLHPGGVPFPPILHLNKASLSQGFSLFTLNCAPCHTITGAGDALAYGYHAPPLHGVTWAQIWEAVRSGPQNMPQFSTSNITPAQLDNIISYVTGKIEHPQNPGGLSLGGVGPVAEGFVGLFVGVGACLLAAYWVGDRTERDEDHEENEHGSDNAPEGAHA